MATTITHTTHSTLTGNTSTVTSEPQPEVLDRDERLSLSPLDPEAALRALLGTPKPSDPDPQVGLG